LYDFGIMSFQLANKTRLISVGEVEMEAVKAEGRKSPLIRIVLLGLVSPLQCLCPPRPRPQHHNYPLC